MRRFFGYMAIIGIILSMTSSCRRTRVIPEDDLVDMYAEILMCDQWILSEGLTTSADTHFVYKPIFDKYGYTADDYRLTVAEYLRKPADYASIFTKVKEMLDARNGELEDRLRALHVSDSVKRADMKRWDLVPKPVLYKDVLTGLFPSDTVCPGPDSLRYSIGVPVLDTMFSGPVLVLRQISDSLAVEAVPDGTGTMVPDSSASIRKLPPPPQKRPKNKLLKQDSHHDA